MSATDFYILAVVYANAITAFIAIYFGQGATRGAGFHCPLAMILLVHRALYFGLAFVLMVNATDIYNRWELPQTSSLALEISLFAVSVFSYFRHTMAPPIPLDASWSKPAIGRGVTLTSIGRYLPS